MATYPQERHPLLSDNGDTTRPGFPIGGHELRAGSKAEIELPLARLVTGTAIALPVVVFHGESEGPVLWMSAAIHGDEIAGVEIIRRVTADLDPANLCGTVVAVPVVNVHGFLTGDRYLPDRRDLNRSFPGSNRGSLASQLANLMMREVVHRCTVGIDLHTGSDHRTNLPQIRANLDDPATNELAHVFDAPLMIHARERDGSLRAAAAKAGATTLLYEGGEAWRFDEDAIAVGERGVRRVMRHMGMVPGEPNGLSTTIESRKSRWTRASRSGIAQLLVSPGDTVRKGAVVAVIHDSFGNELSKVRTGLGGMVIGRTHYPLVNRGDAVVHIASLEEQP